MNYLAQIDIPTAKGLGNIYDNFEYSNLNKALGNWTSKVLQYSIIIAGLIFFVKLVSGGFSYLTSAGDQGKVQAATKELTNALIGLIIVISTFFIIQILEVILGIKVL